MKNKTKNKNKRPITSILAFISFMYVVPTGILTHFGEHGLEQFQDMIGATHWTSSLIFLVSAIIHIVLNWKSMKRYIFTEIEILSGFKKEFVLIFLIVTLLIALVAVPFLLNPTNQ
ncbi:MAG: DUF4405 domain-containing protein [Spirochaetes bacterium]|nr:DUF4405 domain-containing protein [Spirochaetota bacterium]